MSHLQIQSGIWGAVQREELDFFAPAVCQRGGAAGRRVLAAGVEEEAAVGDVNQMEVGSLQDNTDAQQHGEERRRRAEDRHHERRGVPEDMLRCGCEDEEVFSIQPGEKEKNTFS